MPDLQASSLVVDGENQTATGDVVLTPFMGVGSEVYGAVMNGRKGVGCELKPSYFVQAVKNLKAAEETLANGKETTRNMFDGLVDDEPTAAE